MDHDKLNDCLMQIAREWSKNGEQERLECFDLIKQELTANFEQDSYGNTVVLVPGCGLARLPYDIASMGFQAIGNERDPFQLFAGNFILNNCDKVDSYNIYPWIYDLSSRIDSSWVTTPVSFPDVDPSSRPDDFQLQMMPGDFLKEVKENLEDESVNAVVTAFFLDSAPNVLEYVDAIKKVLAPGGIWINFGALNFPHDELTLSLNDMKKVIQTDFEFIKDEVVLSSYGQCDKMSMTSSKLQCSFFTCKKK